MSYRNRMILYGVVVGLVDSLLLAGFIDQQNDIISIVALLFFMFGLPLLFALVRLFRVIDDHNQDRGSFYFWGAMSVVVMFSMIAFAIVLGYK